MTTIHRPSIAVTIHAILGLLVFVLAAAPTAVGAEGQAGDRPFAELVAPGTHIFDVRQAFLKMDAMTGARFLRSLPASGRRDLYPLSVEALHSDKALLVEAGIDALWEIRVPLLMENLHVIRERLLHHEPRIRWVAAIVIGKLHDDLAIENLLAILSDREMKVRTAAREALAKIAGVDHGPRPEDWRPWFSQWLEAEQNVIPTLAARLDDEDEATVQRTVHTLSQLKSHRHSVGDLLAGLTEHASPQIRLLALSTLKGMGGVAALKSPEAVGKSIREVLDEVLSQEIPRARFQATEAVEPDGIQLSQIITIAVILLLLGGGLAWVVSWSKKNPTRVKRMTQRLQKTASKQTERIAKNLKRITFTK